MPGILYQSSPLYLILFAIASFALAWLLYINTKHSYSTNIKRVLFTIRFIIIFILLFLLLSPFVQYISRESEQPVLVVAYDNSLSIQEVTPQNQLKSLESQLQQGIREFTEAGYEVYFQDLNSQSNNFPDSINYDSKETNLRKLLSNIQNSYEDRNLKSVLLVSDGIYNTGSSPSYYKYPFNLFTLGVGDTIAREDLAINEVNYNKVSYEGNKFPVQIEVLNEGLVGKESVISINNKGKVVGQQRLSFTRKRELKTLNFLIDATEKGTQRYEVVLKAIDGEYTTVNNRKNLFIEIVEGKDNILIVSRQPHPDIKAISQTIGKNQNYDIDLYIPSLNHKQPQKDAYDLVILHQLTPSDPIVQRIRQFNEKTPYWVIFNKRLRPSEISSIDLVQFNQLSGQKDEVTANYNTGFSPFTLNEHTVETLPYLPPLMVPFGNISVSGTSEVLLNQTIGSLETSKPLLIFSKNEPKRALLLGEGLWRWKLNDYLLNENHEAFDELISKSVQYLSTKTDTKKLRIYPLENTATDQGIVFETEIYNDLYERIYEVPVKLIISDEEGNKRSFEYTTSEGSSKYRVSGLQPGIFSFTGEVETGGNVERANGRFSLENQQIEFNTLQADFQLLHHLAEENNGEFTTLEGLQGLIDTISQNVPPSLLRSYETFDLLLNLEWVLVILVLFATIEWFFRKYYGVV